MVLVICDLNIGEVAMKTVRMDQMTWKDIKHYMSQGYRTVVLGIGSTEQHGPSLPLRTDRKIADTEII